MKSKLLEQEKKGIKGDTSTDFPIMFIVAPPRSGTTLLYQLISLKYDVFYPTNLIAKFYNAPYDFLKSIGDLDIFSQRMSSDFKSDLGNTSSIFEPHEWGWFWERFLCNEENTLVNELSAIQSLYLKPMLFKNIYFNYNIEFLANTINQSIFLRIKRDEVDTINSIYNAILKRGFPIGSKYHKDAYEKFINKPLELATIEYFFDEKTLDEHLGDKKVINISYEKMIHNLDEVLDLIENKFFQYTGSELSKKSIEINKFEKQTIVDDKIKVEIEKLAMKYSRYTLEALNKVLFGV